MGNKESKIKNPNANVVNNIEVKDHTEHLNSIWCLLLTTLIINILHFLIAIYKIHKRSLKKKYISRADDSNKI